MNTTLYESFVKDTKLRKRGPYLQSPAFSK